MRVDLLALWFSVFMRYAIEVPDVDVSATSCAVAMLWLPVEPSEARVMDVHVLPPSALYSAVRSSPSVVDPAPLV